MSRDNLLKIKRKFLFDIQPKSKSMGTVESLDAHVIFPQQMKYSSFSIDIFKINYSKFWRDAFPFFLMFAEVLVVDKLVIKFP